ncbi:unannotated protein [freshwater metagenome]|uniref:Unannotated protein n=1 Tax=freshwater metagenome TaxID=449393 RepID=A0A6J7BKA1_9ZZZZ|nr:OmpA family protein [Actinomycetota bacterium]
MNWEIVPCLEGFSVNSTFLRALFSTRRNLLAAPLGLALLTGVLALPSAAATADAVLSSMKVKVATNSSGSSASSSSFTATLTLDATTTPNTYTVDPGAANSSKGYIRYYPSWNSSTINKVQVSTDSGSTWSDLSTGSSIKSTYYSRSLSPALQLKIWPKSPSGTSVIYVLRSTASGAVVTQSNIANLSALTLTNPTPTSAISPTFSSGTLSYSATVATESSTVRVTATLETTTATMTINGDTATSGSPKTISVSPGANTITIAVTAQNGTTKKSYSIAYTNGTLSSDATLASLALSTGTLSPSFSSSSETYTATVPTNTSSISFTPTVNQSQARVSVNGSAVVSGSPSSQTLSSTITSIPVRVTSGNGTTKTYTVVVRKGASSTSTLSTIVPSSGYISANCSSTTPVAISAATTYCIKTTYTKSLRVTPTATDPAATILVDGRSSTSGNQSEEHEVEEDSDAKTIIVKVTSPDKSSTTTYTFTISREAARTENRLEVDANNKPKIGVCTNGAISLTSLTMRNSSDDEDHMNFTATVPNYQTSVQLGAYTRSGSGTTLLFNGVATASGACSSAIPLNPGNNKIVIMGSAEKENEKRSYVVNIVRQGNNTATLGALVFVDTSTGSTLSPSFVPDSATALNYTLTLPYKVSSLRVQPSVTAGSGATIRIGEKDVTSGSISEAIKMEREESGKARTIKITVTSQDKKVKNTYTITINRQAPSTNANLKTLELKSNVRLYSGGTCDVPSGEITGTGSGATKTFALTTSHKYYAKMPYAKTFKVTTHTEGHDEAGGHDAKVKVDDEEVEEGHDSHEKKSEKEERDSHGDKKERSTKIKVTAEDEKTSVTYEVVECMDPPTKNANLTNLVASAGALTGAFSSSTKTYRLVTTNSTTTLTPTLSDTENATLAINTDTATSGVASRTYNLSPGLNTFKVKVTADDDVTTSTYTVMITRGPIPATTPTLHAFTLGGTAVTSFVADTASPLDFTATIDTNTATVNLAATATTTGDTVTINTTSGVSSSSITGLSTPAGETIVTVTVEHGTDSTVYNLTITRPLSDINTLSALTSSLGTWSSTYPTCGDSCTVSATNTQTSITLTPTTTHPNATITVRGLSVTSGSPTQSIALDPGANIIEVVVTSENGTPKTYTVTVNRAPNGTSAAITALTTSVSAVSPTFPDAGNTYRTDTATATTATATVTLTLQDPAASVLINGVSATPNATTGVTTSQALPLAEGDNTATIVVTPQSMDTPTTYVVVIPRAGNLSLNTLASLTATVPTTTLSPAFNEATAAYTASVASSVSSITITGTATSATSLVAVNSETATAGSSSRVVTLVNGINTIPVEVTAQDGSVNVYSVVITRALSSNADLTNLAFSAGALSPAFATATLSYTVGTVAVATTTVTATLSDTATARLSINGASSTSGVATASIPLVSGANTFTILVIAEDGTVKKYSVIVTRSADSAVNTLSALSTSAQVAPFSSPTGLSPTFASGTNFYDVGTVVSSVETTTVTATVSDLNSTLSINDQAVTINGSGVGTSSSITLSGGVTSVPVVVTAQNGSVNIYVVNFTKALSTEAHITAMATPAGTTKSVSFTETTYTETITVPASLDFLDLDLTLKEAHATVTINGVDLPVVSGIASPSLALTPSAGDTFVIVVTAQDGSTKLTYTVITQRASTSSDATLATLTTSAGSIVSFNTAGGSFAVTEDPTYKSDTFTITAGATMGGVTQIDIQGWLADGTTADTQTVASGDFALFPVVSGSKAYLITTTAEDGTTQKSYTITIDALAPSSTSASFSVRKSDNTAIASGALKSGVVIKSLRNTPNTPWPVPLASTTWYRVNAAVTASTSSSACSGTLLGTSDTYTVTSADIGKFLCALTLTSNAAGIETLTVSTVESVTGTAPTISFTTPTNMARNYEIDWIPVTIAGAPAPSITSFNLPTGLVFETATARLSGSPTATAGSYTFSLTATNAYGSATDTHTVTLTDPPITKLPTPAKPTAGATGTTTMNVSFEIIPHASAYRVKVYDVAGTTLLNTINGVTTTPNSVTGLTASTQYRFTVTARGDGVAYSDSDASALSDPVATLNPPTPPPPAIPPPVIIPPKKDAEETETVTAPITTPKVTKYPYISPTSGRVIIPPTYTPPPAIPSISKTTPTPVVGATPVGDPVKNGPSLIAPQEIKTKVDKVEQTDNTTFVLQVRTNDGKMETVTVHAEESGVKVDAPKKFTGVIQVPFGQDSESGTATSTLNVVVNPDEVTNANRGLSSPTSSTVSWEASPNAIGYSVSVNGRPGCTTPAGVTTCQVPTLVGPKSEVIVTAIGNDATAAVKSAEYSMKDPVTIKNINFNINSPVLTSAAKKELNAIIAIVKKEGFTTIAVAGHTDLTGPKSNSLPLSTARTSATVAYLKAALPNIKFIKAAFGDTTPLVSGTTADANAANRRADIGLK